MPDDTSVFDVDMSYTRQDVALPWEPYVVLVECHTFGLLSLPDTCNFLDMCKVTYGVSIVVPDVFPH